MKALMKVERVISNYPPGPIGVSIVHIGLGAFMRSHLAVYTEKVLTQMAGDWGICAVNIRSNADIVTTLQKQHCVYNIAEYQRSDEVCLREISAVREVLYAGAGQSTKLLERLQDQAIKIVSLTVTEKGYYLNSSDRCLLSDDESILHDLENPESPKTVPGILVNALKFRYENELAPFTLLSCDNMPENGESLKSAVIQFASINNPDLADWIAATVSFPSCMVDRIVPAVTETSRAEINRLLLNEDEHHQQDNAAVACESYTQWLIEDNFSQGRPEWEKAGAQFVSKVEPFEEMKLRLLNGSHSLLAYLGSLGELVYVSDCMQKADYIALIKQYMLKEAAPTLHMPEGVDINAYIASLLERFANDSLQHRTAQIAMDGSQKIPQRWLMGVDALLKDSTLPKISALGIAAWMRYVGGIDEQGKTIEVSDPIAASLKAICEEQLDPGVRVKALLQTSVFAQHSLVTHPEFVQCIIDFYKQLVDVGARETVRIVLQD